MTQTLQTELQALTEKVEAVEAIELGDSFGEPLREVETELENMAGKVETAQDVARTSLIERHIKPVSADVLAARAEYLDNSPSRAQFVEHVLDVHRRAVVTWPELAQALRTPEVVAQVVGAGRADAAIYAQDAKERGDNFRRRFLDGLAAQLAERGHNDPIGEVALAYQATRDLTERVRAVRARHEEHSKAELRRAEQARIEAERARIAESKRRIQAAQDAADQADIAARQARHEAEQIYAAIIKERLDRARKDGHEKLRVPGGDVYMVDYLMSQAGAAEPKFLQRVEAALDKIAP